MRRAAARLRYRAVVLCYVSLNVPSVGLPDTYYFPERRFPFNRVTEQKRFSPATAPPERTVLCMDLACDPHDPTFAASDAGLRALVLPALEEAGLLPLRPSKRSSAGASATPTPSTTSTPPPALRHVSDWLARVPNLWVVGRQGLFLHNNTDHSLLMGYRAADAVAAGGDRRAWASRLETFGAFRVAD